MAEEPKDTRSFSEPRVIVLDEHFLQLLGPEVICFYVPGSLVCRRSEHAELFFPEGIQGIDLPPCTNQGQLQCNCCNVAHYLPQGVCHNITTSGAFVEQVCAPEGLEIPPPPPVRPGRCVWFLDICPGCQDPLKEHIWSPACFPPVSPSETEKRG
jgi:hypothetical protein